jgi:hypothetical protein
MKEEVVEWKVLVKVTFSVLFVSEMFLTQSILVMANA